MTRWPTTGRAARPAVALAFVALSAAGCGSAESAQPGADIERPAQNEPSTSTDVAPSIPLQEVDGGGLEAVLDAARDGYRADGAIAVLNVEGVRVGSAVGVADADGSPTDVGMRFRAGSITKTITAALVLDQVAQGHLGLDDDVAAIVGPPLRPTPPVTVRMLLDHTSGIFDIGNDGDPIADIAELTDPGLLAEVDDLIDRAASGESVVASARLVVGLAETHPRDFEPGSAFGYSNTNYQLAGMLIETVSGQHFAEVLADRLARPLELASTTLAPDDTSSPEFRGTALDLDTGAEIDATDDLLAFGNGGSGGLITTADELLTIITAIVHGPLLPDELRSEMLNLTPQSEHTYGLGIAPYVLSCGRFLGHEGRVNGTVSLAIVDADNPDRGVVVTMNSTIGNPGLAALADDLVCSP